jgi:uncharacterized protein
VKASFTFDVGNLGAVTALVYRAKDPAGATLVLAHGAGASQRHPFMVDVARRLATRGIDVVTFDFLYTAQGRKMPDKQATLEAAWRAAIASVRAREGLPSTRFFIGGKSMGGRMAAHVAAADDGIDLTGLVFLGYPLHPPGKPSMIRDVPLRVPFPMLFVQGTRDDFGSAKEVQKLVRGIEHARVFAVEGGDHSLALPARDSGKQDALLDGAMDVVAKFVRGKGRSRR